ncbi:MAG: HEPN domain-containing protein [Bacteroidales bacterium]|nr:HEPN domain-containing protein [Bacteroidales bacterium]
MSVAELIKYRISRAWEAYEEAIILSKENHWNTVANRLYYSCFYIASALLLQQGKRFESHKGVKSEFHRSFVKEGIVNKESGKTFNRLFNLRHEGDYADFKRLTEEDISPFLNETKKFITEVESLIHNAQ